MEQGRIAEGRSKLSAPISREKPQSFITINETGNLPATRQSIFLELGAWSLELGAESLELGAES
jgi:hypothetical protein